MSGVDNHTDRSIVYTTVTATILRGSLDIHKITIEHGPRVLCPRLPGISMFHVRSMTSRAFKTPAFAHVECDGGAIFLARA